VNTTQRTISVVRHENINNFKDKEAERLNHGPHLDAVKDPNMLKSRDSGKETVSASSGSGVSSEYEVESEHALTLGRRARSRPFQR
jgi:hypothetical protein